MQSSVLNIAKLFVLIGAYALISNARANDEGHQRYIRAIDQMVEQGVLSEQEAKEQIGQLKMAEEDPQQDKISSQGRGIASTLSKQKIIEFSNEPIEIQVK